MFGVDFRAFRTQVAAGLVVAAIVGTVAMVVPSARAYVGGLLELVWMHAASGWDLLTASYAISGWLLVVLIVLSCAAVVGLLRAVWPQRKPDFVDYTEDEVRGCIWRWRWRESREGDYYPERPIPYCPKCRRELVAVPEELIGETRLHCERCGTEISVVPRATLYQVEEYVLREIRGRVRTDEYKEAMKRT